MMINRIKNNIKKQYIIVFMLGVVLSIIYGSKINNVNTVWELGDEAGYLCNVAYMAGTDWSDVASVLPYFGYGYSIILIPIFLVSRTGIELIHGAIFINVICVMITYMLEVYVFSKLLKNINIGMVSFFGFISVLIPYMTTNTFKVLCEVFLTMWVWIIASLLVLTYKMRKWWTYVILGVATAYIFFIHTRAIIIIVSVIITISIMLCKRLISKKNIFIFLFSTAICFGILYIIKKDIIAYSMHLGENDARTDVNMVSSNYIFTRIKWFLADYPLYIIEFAGKILYLTASTCGVILYGIAGICKEIKKQWQENGGLSLIIYCYFAISFFVMLAACVLNGAGMEDNFTYLFYSRYYEYTVLPIIIIGLYNIYFDSNNIITNIIFAFIIISTGIISSMAQTFLLNTDEIHVDTARIPGFTHLIMEDTSYRTFIFHITIFCVAVIVIIAIFKMCFKDKRRCILIISIFLFLFSNSKDCMNKVFQSSIDAKADTQLAAYVTDVCENNDVLFVDSDFKWKNYYSRMQVLLKNKKLVVISESEINQNEYFITYLSSTLGNRLEKEGRLVKRGAVFGLYYID